MSTPKIKFGTDGWRAVMARDYTFENVSLVARAVSKTMHEQMPGKKKMLVGYDRRLLSKEFAQAVSTVYVEEGYEVLLGNTYLPTPALSWWAKHEPGAAGATVITASHNPPTWNGFKYKETFGGSAFPATTQKFEQAIESLAAKGGRPPSGEAYDRAVKEGKIQLCHPRKGYFEGIRKQIDLDVIRKAKPKVVLDVMHGSASGHYVSLLHDLNIDVLELHGEENPGFRGVAPEPIGKNLTELCETVRKGGYACGLATDGDADRLGAVDEEGNYFTTQQILSVVYWHMLKNRKKKWNISRSVSTTRMVDLVAKRAGQTCHETPVGFKFIAEHMINGKAQIGGEESGGIGIIDHIPERDGLLTGLLLLEIIATTGKGLKQVYEDLCQEERPYHFIRHDIRLADDVAQKATDRLKLNPPSEWNGRKVDQLETKDGYKFYLTDGSWLLIRKSGTEPIFRLYAETESPQESEKLVRTALKFVEER